MSLSQKHCDKFAPSHKGYAVKEIPELARCLEKIGTNYMNWISMYRCQICGQVWTESWENKGHGEVSFVRKVEENS